MHLEYLNFRTESFLISQLRIGKPGKKYDLSRVTRLDQDWNSLIMKKTFHVTVLYSSKTFSFSVTNSPMR